jgi:hypothetical protein
MNISNLVLVVLAVVVVAAFLIKKLIPEKGR